MPLAAGAASHAHGVVTFADQPGSAPNTPFVITGFEGASVANIDTFQYLMWRPLYWTGWPGNATKEDTYNIAQPPVYSNGGKTLTITLKHYLWSDGQPVTSRDVEFWLNLVKANKAQYYAYVPGELPDNITAFHVLSSTQFSITFNAVYSHAWIINEIAQIIPIPQQSWDKTSATSPVGNYDLTSAGATSVFNYLTAQSNNAATMGSNPLWRVVDGPYHLQAYQAATGRAVLEYNRSYSGPIKPTVAEVIEEPFTTAAAEFNALRAGDVEYGYVPAEDVDQVSALKRQGFQVSGWAAFGTTFIAINFTNPTVGPLFKQLYFRQVLQRLIDQPAYIKDFFAGYASPDYGPVPAEAAGVYAGPAAKTNPYPYSPSTAAKLLKQHGWDVKPNGSSDCVRPGSAPDDCGAGIKGGETVSLTMEYASGEQAWTSEMESLRSGLAGVGIQLTLTSAPFNTVLTYALPCDPSTGAGCSWDMLYYGAGEFYTGYSTPTGNNYFACTGAANFDGYCSATADDLITDTLHSGSLQALYSYEKYLGEQIPYLWLPQPDYQISVVSKSLAGALPQDPELTISPESWRLH